MIFAARTRIAKPWMDYTVVLGRQSGAVVGENGCGSQTSGSSNQVDLTNCMISDPECGPSHFRRQCRSFVAGVN